MGRWGLGFALVLLLFYCLGMTFLAVGFVVLLHLLSQEAGFATLLHLWLGVLGMWTILILWRSRK